jgi:hypothetical protein
VDAEIDQVKGSIVAGFSFPTATSFQLKCVNFNLLREKSIAALDLLFSGMQNVRIFNTGELLESNVMEISRTDGQPVRFRFELAHGFIAVDCRELHIRRITIG